MDSGQKTFSELVSGNCTFQIPRYQRNYAWERSQLEDLWRDLETILRTDKSHFMGTVLLRENAADSGTTGPGITEYDVIDGQQRLTTLQILLYVVWQTWTEEDEAVASNLRRSYIEPHYGFKLTLRGEDGRFFKEEILGGTGGEQPPNITPETASQDRLKAAERYFEQQLRERRADVPEDFDDFWAYLQELTDVIANLEFMVYNVASASEAVRIFEATNDRGKTLTDLERTKSFLMYQLHLCFPEDEEGVGRLEEYLNDVRDEFKDMYVSRQRAKNGRASPPSLSRIQRYHFIVWDDSAIRTRNPAYRDYLSELKEHFRAMSNAGEEAEAKADRILEYVKDLRGAFNAVEEIHTGAFGSEEVDDRLARLLSFGSLGNFYPILIATRAARSEAGVTEDQVVALLDRIESYTFRGYFLMDYRSNKRKNGCYELGRAIHDGTRTIPEVTEQLEQYIGWDCDDEQVRKKLRSSRFYKDHSNKRLRYLLYFYDVHLSRSDEHEHLHLDFDEVVEKESEGYEITIEHVWPRDREKLDLTEEEEQLYGEYRHRLGNLALMKRTENSSESNKPFHQKRDRYEDARIFMLNELADPAMRSEWGSSEWDHDEWGIEQIEAREEKLIGFVLDRWPEYEAEA